ncbi:hypothetical protein NL676_023049 [Syzygium grande]|nr:hypothetical protein NL676_023049 [Syzygium grande]
MLPPTNSLLERSSPTSPLSSQPANHRRLCSIFFPTSPTSYLFILSLFTLASTAILNGSSMAVTNSSSLEVMEELLPPNLKG